MVRGSMMKYFADRGGPHHGGKLHWPGDIDGFPFRSESVPHLKQDEADRILHVMDYKSRMFCLWDPADKAEFDGIMDRIVNGWFMQHRREDTWDAEHKHYRVWLEWVQVYGEAVAAKHPGMLPELPVSDPIMLHPEQVGGAPDDFNR